ncbi:hypothetical protein ABZP36_004451, partial [Zizania latifolia]
IHPFLLSPQDDVAGAQQTFAASCSPLLSDKKGRAASLPLPDLPRRLPVLGARREWRGGGAMCKLKFNKERVGCYLLVILVVVLLVGVLFGLGVFRHSYERFKNLGHNHTCYDCNTG